MRLLLMFMLCLSYCCSNNAEFDTYLANYKDINLPFTMTSDIIPSLNDNPIREKQVKTYIRDTICYEIMYNYGRKFMVNDKYIATIFTKFYDLGVDVYKRDLAELYLIIYDKKGNILSKKCISKDNIMWSSELVFNTDYTINLKQVKLAVEPEDNEKDFNCDITYVTYHINEGGGIEDTINKRKKGIANFPPQLYGPFDVVEVD